MFKKRDERLMTLLGLAMVQKFLIRRANDRVVHLKVVYFSARRVSKENFFKAVKCALLQLDAHTSLFSLRLLVLLDILQRSLCTACRIDEP